MIREITAYDCWLVGSLSPTVESSLNCSDKNHSRIQVYAEYNIYKCVRTPILLFFSNKKIIDLL